MEMTFFLLNLHRNFNNNTMKPICLILSILAISSLGFAQNKSKNFYDFKVKTIDGKEFSFSELKGKKVMIVNTASECGFTPQYEDLENLYKQYGGDKFVILGFPANNFGAQEPGKDEEIKAFCSKNYGVTFPMFSKISVKGDDEAELYKWLTKKTMNGVSDASVKWNFTKFLIDENGKWFACYASPIKPTNDEIIYWIKGGK
jgi:glutathione peroxidase